MPPSGTSTAFICDQPVVDDGDQRDAGEARVEAELRRVADAIGRLVERDLEHVGRLRRRRGDVPAGVELVARRRGVVAAALDGEAVAAPVDLRRDRDRAVGLGVDLAGRDALGAGDDLVVPVPVGAVPLVVGDRSARAARSRPGAAMRCAVGRGEDHVEAGGRAFLDLVVAELRLDADHRRVRRRPAASAGARPSGRWCRRCGR